MSVPNNERCAIMDKDGTIVIWFPRWLSKRKIKTLSTKILNTLNNKCQ